MPRLQGERLVLIEELFILTSCFFESDEQEFSLG